MTDREKVEEMRRYLEGPQVRTMPPMERGLFELYIAVMDYLTFGKESAPALEEALRDTEALLKAAER
jgi:hypothetical protein